VLILLLLAQNLTPHDVEGVWWTQGGNAQVEVVEEDGSVRGTFIWTAAAAEVAAGRTVDKDALPEVYRLGKVLFEHYERGEDRWTDGTIYNLEDGKSYSSTLRRVDGDMLAVEGCLGIFCRTQLFERTDASEVKRLEMRSAGLGQTGTSIRISEMLP
jgi:uncharacterized protein (DUF2147 family)